MTPPTEQTATGTFDVKMTPVGDGTEPIGLMQLDKTFQGGIAGTATGRMLTVMTPVQGSAAYVALERIIGTLNGKRGSFALQHRGTMDKGAPSLEIMVVPDSGTDELTGLRGTMDLDLSGGKHAYTLRYTLPG